MLRLIKNLILLLTTAVAFSVGKAQNVGINTQNPGSIMTVNGSFAADYKIVTTNTTLGISDYYTTYNGNTAGTISLPAAINGVGNFKGRIYCIKNTSNSALTVSASGAELLDDGTSDIPSIIVPPGYHLKLISKGTATGSTWEVFMLTKGKMDAILQVSGTPYSVTKGSAPVTYFNVNSNAYAVVSNSSSTFTLPVSKPIFLSFGLGIDEAGAGSGRTPYLRCELFIDGVATGLYQIVQEYSDGYQLRFNISGVRTLSAGEHTIDARIIRWYNSGIGASTNQSLGTLSVNFDAVYLN